MMDFVDDHQFWWMPMQQSKAEDLQIGAAARVRRLVAKTLDDR
jgi:hypothetical protein